MYVQVCVFSDPVRMLKFSSAHRLASNPGSPFWILSRSSDFSPKLRDKIQNGEPGFEANTHLERALTALIWAGI